MPTRYDELYRQSQLTNQNTQQPLMGAAGGGTTLMGGMNPAMMAGVAQGAASMISPVIGRVNWGSNLFNFSDAFRSPQDERPLSTPADLNQEAAFTGKTMREIYDEARTAELSNMEAFRDTQRQMAARQGSTMYEQAQMAMSQRQLMSDARGLSGGAQEFAERGLGAQEQMVLAQIQNSTMDQLLQIDAESLQDSNIATEVGLRAMQLEEQLNPAFREAAEIRRAAEMAWQSGNEEEYSRLMDVYFSQTDQLYGTNLSGLVSGSGQLDTAALAQTIAKFNEPPTAGSAIMTIGAWSLGGGAALLGAGKVAGVTAGTPVGNMAATILAAGKKFGLVTTGTAGMSGLPAGVKGLGLIKAGGWGMAGAGVFLLPAIKYIAIAALVGVAAYGLYKVGETVYRAAMSDEARDRATQNALRDFRQTARDNEWTDQAIETAVEAAKRSQKLPPRAANW
jgi:hypothetical protein